MFAFVTMSIMPLSQLCCSIARSKRDLPPLQIKHLLKNLVLFTC